MKSLFAPLVEDVVAQARELAAAIEELPLEQKVEALNQVRALLHAVSPFCEQPVDYVAWVPADEVEGNDYNPNNVAPPEMRLLKISVDHDGFTQPIVTWPREDGMLEVVDGEHRTRVGREREELHGYLPVTQVSAGRQGRKDRMAATIRHNRARGVHAVMSMTDIVAELVGLGWTDEEVAQELGMDADEVLRFKQTAGIADLFKDCEYSKAWE